MGTVVTFQPIVVATGSADTEGRLVLVDGELVAVLVRLSTDHAPEFRGAWFLEAGFGPLDGPHHPSFRDLQEAEDWIRDRLKGTTERNGPMSR